MKSSAQGAKRIYAEHPFPSVRKSFSLRLVIVSTQVLAYSLALLALEDRYGYARISFQPTDAALFVVTLLVLLPLLTALLPSRVTSLGDGSLWLMASFVVTPSVALAISHPEYHLDRAPTGLAVSLVGLICLKLFLALSRAGTERAQVNWGGNRSSLGILVVLFVVAAGTLVLAHGVPSVNLRLNDIYERRYEASRVQIPFPLAEHLLLWASYLAVPGLLAWSILSRRWLPGSLACLFAVMYFSVTGARVLLFVVFIAIAVTLTLMRERRSVRSRNLFGGLLTALIAIPVAVQCLLPSSDVAMQLTRRLGIVPAQLGHDYVRYTEVNGNTLFVQHLPSWLSGSGRLILPKDVSAFVGAPGSHTNANVWADGYASLGFLGVVLTSLAMAVLLVLLNRLVVRDQDLPLFVALLTASFTWVNGSLIGSFVSYGLLFGLGVSLVSHRGALAQREWANFRTHPKPRGARVQATTRHNVRC